MPPGVVAVQILFKAVGEDGYRRWLRGELGVVENLTVLFLAVSVVTALRMFLLRKRVASPLFGPFVLVMALGCFFFAGEEASWGQHWAGFEPPEAVARRNDQGEFNLHNDPFFEKVLDQLPRNLLTAAALIGGIAAPLLLRRRGRPGPRFEGGPGGWIWPTMVCLPAAVVAVTVTLPEKLFEALDREVPYLIDISPGETKEFCLGLFLMCYLVTLHRALKAQPQARAEPS